MLVSRQVVCCGFSCHDLISFHERSIATDDSDRFQALSLTFFRRLCKKHARDQFGQGSSSIYFVPAGGTWTSMPSRRKTEMACLVYQPCSVVLRSVFTAFKR